MALALFLQETTVAEVTVHLAPQQMAEIATQSQGNTAFICGFIAFALVGIAGIFWRSTGL